MRMFGSIATSSRRCMPSCSGQGRHHLHQPGPLPRGWRTRPQRSVAGSPRPAPRARDRAAAGAAPLRWVSAAYICPEQGQPLVMVGHVRTELWLHELVPDDRIVLVAKALGRLERLLHHRAQFRIALGVRGGAWGCAHAGHRAASVHDQQRCGLRWKLELGLNERRNGRAVKRGCPGSQWNAAGDIRAGIAPPGRARPAPGGAECRAVPRRRT